MKYTVEQIHVNLSGLIITFRSLLLNRYSSRRDGERCTAESRSSLLLARQVGLLYIDVLLLVLSEGQSKESCACDQSDL